MPLPVVSVSACVQQRQVNLKQLAVSLQLLQLSLRDAQKAEAALLLLKVSCLFFSSPHCAACA